LPLTQYTHPADNTQQRFVLALTLTGLVLIAEVAGGLFTGSLALLSDAAHVLLDVLALGLSYAALRMAARPADDRHTYGFHRFQVLAALANGATLLLVAFGIFREAGLRLREPSPVLAGPMLVVAVFGLVINLIVLRVLGGHDHRDLNVRSVFLHVAGDTLSSVGVIIAGLIVLLTGWTLVDPLISLGIGLVILVGSARVLRSSLHILVEGTPEGLKTCEVAQAMSQVAHVHAVHDLHVWAVSPGYAALSAHVVLSDQSLEETQDVRDELKRVLTGRFGIEHTTIQFECADCGQGALTCAGTH
jgi:cobalt-zinc-cadmium efflux system protein